MSGPKDQYLDEFNVIDEDEKLPIRARSHELETESHNFFRNIIPDAWLTNEYKVEYGTDFCVEIFEKGKPTGLEFIAQVKASDRLKKRII